MACTIKFKDGTEMSEAQFYAWAMDNIDLEKFKKTGSIVYIDKKAEEVKFSAIRKLAANIQKSFQLLFGKNVEVITDTKEIDKVLAGDRKNIKMQIDGKEITVKPMGVEVVNGFYSNTEKALSQVKQEKMTGNQWATQLLSRGAKKTEMTWTGLESFLKENGSKSISKNDIQQYLKDNRIEVVEVVKKNIEKKQINTTSVKEVEIYSKNNNVRIIGINKEGEGLVIDDKFDEFDNFIIEILPTEEEKNRRGAKFSSYQLEGEKENYKEVLVLLPKAENSIKEYNSVKDEMDSFVKEVGSGGVTDSQRKKHQEFKNKLSKLKEKIGDKGFMNNGYFFSKNNFKSSHFDEPNILVHLRMNTRIDSEGNKVLFLEEVQSDWGQEGKRRGFSKPTDITLINQLEKEKQDVLNSSKSYQLLNEKTEGDLSIEVFNAIQQVATNMIDNPYSTDESRKKRFLDDIGKTLSYWEGSDYAVPKMAQEELSNFYDVYNEELRGNSIEVQGYGVSYRLASILNKIEEINEKISDAKEKEATPAAPFVTDTNAWVELGLKVALKEAVRQGADKIAWTTGEQQNNRYDLSKSIKRVDFIRIGENRYKFEALGLDGKRVAYDDNGTTSLQEIENMFGKDIAEKVKADKAGDLRLQGEGLKVGGKGMKSFYGSPTEGSLGIIGSVAKSLFKQTPKTVDINANDKTTQDKIDAIEKKREIIGARREQINKEMPQKRAKNKTEQDLIDKYVKEYKKLGEEFEQYEKDILALKSTQYSIDITPELKAQVEEGQPLFMRDAKGKVLGFVYEGKVYIDPRTASPTTPIHEFGHIWNAYVKENHKAFYKKGISLIKQDGGAYIERVKKNYPHLAEKGREEELYEEALAQAIGDRGQYIAKKDQNKFLSWLKEMWTLVKGSMKLSVSAEALSKMTLNDYTNLVAGSMLKGSEIYALAQAEATSQATSNPKVIKQAVKNLIAVKDKILISVSKLSRELYKAESQGYVAGKKAAAAIEKAKVAYQKEVRKILEENKIPVTLAIEKAISKIKDEMSFAKMLPKIFELDNAGVRLAQIDNIKDLVKKVKKLRKNKSKLSSSDIDYINSIEFPSPYQVFNLEGYAKVLSDLEKNLSKKELIGTDTKLALDNFLEQELDYIQEYKDMMEKIKAVNNALKWKQEYAELKEDGAFAGTDIETEEDWLGLKERISSKGEDASTKDKEAMEKIEAKANEKAKALKSLKDSVRNLMETNKEDIIDSFKEYENTSTPLDYDQIFKNIDNLSYNQLVKLANEIENIIFYNDATGIGEFASLGRLNDKFEKMKRVVTKAFNDISNELSPLSKKIAYAQTPSQIIAELTRGGASTLNAMNFILGNWEAMVSKVQDEYNKGFKEFKDKSLALFGKNAFAHWARIDTYAFINQWVKSDTEAQQNRHVADRVKTMVNQHIAFLKRFNSNNKNPNAILDKKKAIEGLKALESFGVIKNLDLKTLTYDLASDITTASLANKLDSKEQELYNLVINKFKSLSNFRNAMSINYNSNYDEIENYFPTFAKKDIDKDEATIEDLQASFSRMAKDNGRAKGRTKNLADSYRTGFIENFSKGYWEALMVDLGSSEMLDMANLLNNRNFGLQRLSEYNLDETSIGILENAIKEKVLAEKNGGNIYGDAETALRVETKRLGSNIAAGVLLKSASQIFKQPIPALDVNFKLKPKAATLAVRLIANPDFRYAVENLIENSTIKYRLNVYELNPSDLGFPVEYFDALVGDAFSKSEGKRFAALKATESFQKFASDPLFSLVNLAIKSKYDSFLEAGDAYVSKINILTAYIDHQQKAGKTFQEIILDLSKNKIDQSGLRAAEKWQADLNSESKRTNMSERLKKESFFLYMKGFSLTTHQSFSQAIRKLRDKKLRASMDSTEEETWKATRDAFIMQQVMFRLISMSIANWSIASLIKHFIKGKKDDDDEEVTKVGFELAASLASDILLGSSGFVGTAVWALLVNGLWYATSSAIIAQREGESVEDSNRKKLQRPVIGEVKAGGWEVAFVNLFTKLFFDYSNSSGFDIEKKSAATKIMGFATMGLTGSKEIYDAFRVVSKGIEREANVSTLIDKELNADLSDYKYQVSDEDRAAIVKELSGSQYQDIRARMMVYNGELRILKKEAYEQLLADTRKYLFGTDSKYLDTIMNSAGFKQLNKVELANFLKNNKNLNETDRNFLVSNFNNRTITRNAIIQKVRETAINNLKKYIDAGQEKYASDKYKIVGIK